MFFANHQSVPFLKIRTKMVITVFEDDEGGRRVALDRLKYVHHRGMVFDVLNEAYTRLQGSGARKIYLYVANKSCNIPRKFCELFVKFCSENATNKKTPGRPADYRPIISSSFNSRGQVDLIDMQVCLASLISKVKKMIAVRLCVTEGGV